MLVEGLLLFPSAQSVRSWFHPCFLQEWNFIQPHFGTYRKKSPSLPWLKISLKLKEFVQKWVLTIISSQTDHSYAWFTLVVRIEDGFFWPMWLSEFYTFAKAISHTLVCSIFIHIRQKEKIFDLTSLLRMATAFTSLGVHDTLGNTNFTKSGL